MTQSYSGTVKTVSMKPWQDRKQNREIILYSFQLDNTGNRWFRTGTNPVGYNQGEAVQFVADEKGNVDRNTLALATTPQPAQQYNQQQSAPQQKQQYQSKPAKPKENWDARAAYWDAKEIRDKEEIEPRITYQASRAHAVTLVSAALGADALSLTGAKGKRLDLLLDYVDQVTDRFFLQAVHAPEHVKTLQERALQGDEVVDVPDNAYDE